MKTKQTASDLPILIYMFKKHPLYRVIESESYSSYSSGSFQEELQLAGNMKFILFIYNAGASVLNFWKLVLPFML